MRNIILKNTSKYDFDERLRNLMNAYAPILKNANELSRAMHKRGILKYEEINREGKTKTKDESIRNAEKTINNHLGKSDCKNISVEWIKHYCDFFKCSADYLLGYIDLPTHKGTDINKETGLSEDAIHGLQLLHHPIDSILDSVQESRYDIIALNIILEDFYNKIKKTPDCINFGEETDTLLNYIGQYIDASSAAIDIVQNGTLKLYSSREIVQSICRDKITLLLNGLKDKYSLDIIGRRIQNKERFNELYNDSVKKLANKANSKN